MSETQLQRISFLLACLVLLVRRDFIAFCCLQRIQYFSCSPSAEYWVKQNKNPGSPCCFDPHKATGHKSLVARTRTMQTKKKEKDEVERKENTKKNWTISMIGFTNQTKFLAVLLLHKCTLCLSSYSHHHHLLLRQFLRRTSRNTLFVTKG
jgi:hypothetical protein